MTQFKEKSQRHAENINAGLYDYPVLMAADILLYQTKLVPVGDDQKQHLELTRDVAMRFNNAYGPVFTVPEPFIPTVGARVMSLQDPMSKMSKSDANQGGYVSLLDDPDVVRRKIKRAVTDSGTTIAWSPDERPGIANLMSIYSSVSGQTLEQIEAAYQGKGYGHFKGDLAELMVEFLRPVQTRYREVYDDRAGLERILRRGADTARQKAQQTLDRVYEMLGFLPR
jgi:tryptophanyl-tRNA synthetase